MFSDLNVNQRKRQEKTHFGRIKKKMFALGFYYSKFRRILDTEEMN